LGEEHGQILRSLKATFCTILISAGSGFCGSDSMILYVLTAKSNTKVPLALSAGNHHLFLAADHLLFVGKNDNFVDCRQYAFSRQKGSGS
jgi:hypothetical protein